MVCQPPHFLRTDPKGLDKPESNYFFHKLKCVNYFCRIAKKLDAYVLIECWGQWVKVGVLLPESRFPVRIFFCRVLIALRG